MARSKSDVFALELVEQLKKRCEVGSGRIAAFIRYSRQVEGWFKGELLEIAANLEDEGLVREFHPDYRMDVAAGKQNIDLHFILKDGKPVWIELKHWFLGRYPTGARWNATAYFTQSTSGTPNNFIGKLPKGWNAPTYMLLVTTPRPKDDDWNGGLRRLRERHGDKQINSLTRLVKFPEPFFIGLLRLV